jgi:SAM-dependent methyltransferase
MLFDVPGAAYGRFMGRYSEPLAVRFADWAGVRQGERVLDVGCGPGALTAVLAERLGAEAVTAVDPSPSFRRAVRERLPALDVRAASAEELPFPDGTFDHALAQLVVHFMSDPVAGLAEMRRVTRPGGTVATCVWDLAGERGPVSTVWRAALELDGSAATEANLPGARERDLVDISRAAGLVDVQQAELAVTVRHPSFEEWWEPYTLGVGPAGAYVAGLGEGPRARLRLRWRELLPDAPFDITAVAWAARGRVRAA